MVYSLIISSILLKYCTVRSAAGIPAETVPEYRIISKSVNKFEREGNKK